MGLQLIASLAVVVGLLLIIAKVSARRFGARSGATVEVLARQAISRGSGVVVVRVGSRVLVLGSTEQQVSLLTEIDPAEVAAPEPVEDVSQDEELDEEHDEDDPENGTGATVTDFGELLARARQPHPRPHPQPQGALAGSIVSPQTWRQAFHAVARVRGQRTPVRRRPAS
ncbi:flagellar biosynthetic protein FliO [Nocardioides humilatus]|nr:flagellar biosynthetic protein FliO [Nocardioides humilatus]